MSFILDALKKADEARHPRAPSAGGKFRVPRLTPRAARWPWVLSGIVLLAVNGALIGYLAWPRVVRMAGPAGTPASSPPASPPSPERAAPAPEPPAAAAQVPAAPSAARPSTIAPTESARPADRPPAPARQDSRPAPPSDRPAPVAQPRPDSQGAPAAPELLDAMRRLGGASPSSKAAEMPGPPVPASPRAPAAPPQPAPVDAPRSYSPRADAPSPSPPAAAPAGGPDELSKLKLTVHVWAEKPAERLVFINGKKYVQGDRVEDKALLEEITQEGALLSYQGRRSLLRP
jgi:Type II secretion system protein B